jgi:ABC-type transporter lipoprotein component MlaA
LLKAVAEMADSNARGRSMAHRSVRTANEALGTRFVSKRADLLGASDLLSQAAIDEYSFVRDVYLQRRRELSSKPANADVLPDYSGAASQ